MVRPISILLGIAVMAAFALSPAPASQPDSGTITPAAPEVEWSGGPLSGGGGAEAADPCGIDVVGVVVLEQPAACDEFVLKVGIPPSYWAGHPGGIVVRIEWTDENNELDLSVYNPGGQLVADSQFGGREFQQVFIWEPEAGDHRIEVAGFAARNVTYKGRAALTQQSIPQAPTAPNTMRFEHSLVDPQLFGLGPGIWADQEDRVYVSAVQGFGTLTSFVWGSNDGGRTFKILDAGLAGNVSDPRRRPCVASEGGADADVITDRTGRVYFADTQDPSIAIATSMDHGETWQCNPLAIRKPEVHRPWLAPAPSADDVGPEIDAYVGYADFVIGQLPGGNEVRPDQIHVDVTRDGGVTWDPGFSFGAGRQPWPGPLFTGDDGTVYEVFESLNGVWLARSDDEGSTFTLSLISQRPGRPGGLAFVTGDVDSAGNVYAAWAESGAYDILYSYSTDRGEHWSTPVRVNPPDVGTAFLPWLAAGKPGDVAIAWYGTSGSFVPRLAPPAAAWFVYAARTSRGTSPGADFQVTRMSETPVHFGPFGGFGEFMRIAIAPDGSLVGSYNDDGYLGAAVTDVYVMAARQVSGRGMSKIAARSAARSTERAGDAKVPTYTSEGRDVPQLDLTSLPSISLSGDLMHMSFSLSDARRLTDALVDADGAAATDAYWLAIWKANDRLEYAGMHVDATGAPDFFGGDHPVGVLDPEVPTGDFGASYPPMFELEGNVDVESGRVTIEVPLDTFHMRPGDMLHGLQAFSMTGSLPVRTAHTMLDVIDTSPATAVRLQAPGLPPLSTRPNVRGVPVLPATGASGSPLGLAALGCAAALAACLGRQPRRRQGPSSRPTLRR